MSNRLEKESSPYLLQHKDNPVDWYPWGEEAFAKARAEEKPIFLSVGYSTCHWCHVMERESFENLDTARLLSENFVSIKVDREERPDVDSIYMSFVQGMTGSGGWPMTVFLTPDLAPFFAGTYFPPVPRYGVPSFPDILKRIADLWKEKKDELIADSERIKDAILVQKEPQGEEELSLDVAEKAYRALVAGEDRAYGGFGKQPKFPTPSMGLFLHRFSVYSREENAAKMVERQLDGMIRGGLWDHVGGGFARYSVDRKWEIPHFEKMLYDNALLAIMLLESYAMNKSPLYREILGKLFRFIHREMTSESGVFYSAQDADSEGEEGKFQLFDEGEIREILGKDADDFLDFFPVTLQGNFEGKTHLNLLETVGWKDEEARKKMDPLLEKIYMARDKRVRPFLDDKILTAWNGMMIHAYALAGRILGEPEYIRRAEKAARELLRAHTFDGYLLGSTREGVRGPVATLEDAAWLADGLTALYESTLNKYWLDEATKWCGYMTEHYLGEDGGFFLTKETVEHLLYRPRELYDGAVPSAISVATMVLIKISRLTEDESFLAIGDRQLALFAGEVKASPMAHTWMLSAYLLRISEGKDLRLSGVAEQDALQWAKGYLSGFHPFDLLAREDGGDAPALKICRQGTCLLPLRDEERIRDVLNTEKVEDMEMLE
ncbi:MAG: thioredoxin domain-containing protein [Anaerovoracaceae bacterium]|jgi:uncharacterized protein YyaL (SSP411 family)